MPGSRRARANVRHRPSLGRQCRRRARKSTRTQHCSSRVLYDLPGSTIGRSRRPAQGSLIRCVRRLTEHSVVVEEEQVVVETAVTSLAGRVDLAPQFRELRQCSSSPCGHNSIPATTRMVLESRDSPATLTRWNWLSIVSSPNRRFADIDQSSSTPCSSNHRASPASRTAIASASVSGVLSSKSRPP
jgi:hypothetical protein